MHISSKVFKNLLICGLTLLLLFFIWFIFPLGDLFPPTYSTIIYDCKGKLLRATLASDEQFRFPLESDSLPEKYIQALLTFEDRKFYTHHGVSPSSLINSFVQNLKEGRRVRGGSTITMQVARMQKRKSRTYFNKVREIFQALKIDAHLSKNEILLQYASQAPMGGNIVGLPAACYRYFKKPLSQITWGEAAMLAVLPNAPGLVNTEKNRERLKAKRNRLLKTMLSRNIIDTITYLSAQAEEIPRAQPLPFFAPHFTDYVLLQNMDKRKTIHTTLDLSLQEQSERTMQNYYRTIANLGISNCAALICESKSGEVKAYIGSANFHNAKIEGQVDGVQSKRSPGSLLKPFLTAAYLDRGPFHPRTQIYDIPTMFGTYSPANALGVHYGIISLQRALTRSLNIPFIRLLNWYGVDDFYRLLKKAGISSLDKKPMEYGLPLILGAFETSLWELTGLYTTLANNGLKQTPHWQTQSSDSIRIFTHGAAEQVRTILSEVSRPGSEYYWQEFNRQVPVAWKTGTSYGRKDGWAIGTNKKFTIGVWAGNFSGQGNGAIGGASAAGPLLFQLFNRLCNSDEELWFPQLDISHYKRRMFCSQSGYTATESCPGRVERQVPASGFRRERACPFHRTYFIDSTTGSSVCSRCWNGNQVKESRFIVAPPARDILREKGLPVDNIPKHREGCSTHDDPFRMEIIYPKNDISIQIPRNMQGRYEKSVFKVSHQQDDATLFWVLDGRYLGSTSGTEHTWAELLEPGEHTLFVEDEEGFNRIVRFTSTRNSL